jgi:hypothetical protein
MQPIPAPIPTAQVATRTGKGGLPIVTAAVAQPAVPTIALLMPPTPVAREVITTTFITTAVTTEITSEITSAITTTVIVSAPIAPAPVTTITVGALPGAPLPFAKVDTALYAGPDLTIAVTGQAVQGQVLDIVAWHTSGEWYLLSNGSWIPAVAVENGPETLPLVVPTPTFTPSATPTITPTGTPALPTPGPETPTPTPTSLDVAICDCGSDQFECLGSSFLNQAAAQACFEYCFRQRGFDVHNLDPNANGVACENLE